jgi:SAM-dependent methyltransferase
MWLDDEKDYREALSDPTFLCWRELGARQKAKYVIHVSGDLAVESVIEIGCGTGSLIQQLHSLGYARKYIATDLPLSALRFLNKRVAVASFGPCACSALSLPFSEGTFTVALLSHVIEHFEVSDQAVREASRIANLVIIEVPLELVASNVIRTKLFRRRYASVEDAGHVQFWSAVSIEAFLRARCNLEILSVWRDLLDRDVVLFGKKGLAKFKALTKLMVKKFVPVSLYVRLFTTHSTFLCRAIDQRSPNEVEPRGAARLLQVANAADSVVPLKSR